MEKKWRKNGEKSDLLLPDNAPHFLDVRINLVHSPILALVNTATRRLVVAFLVDRCAHRERLRPKHVGHSGVGVPVARDRSRQGLGPAHVQARRLRWALRDRPPKWG